MTMNADTIGLVVDVTHADLQAIRAATPAWRRHLDLTVAMDSRYAVLAGLPNDGEGVFFAALRDDANLVPIVVTAHERLGESGAQMTQWIIIGNEALQTRIKVALADLVVTEDKA
jgi:hypothetical protein